MTESLLPCIELETGAHPDAAIVWLHGLGADGNDFVPIVEEMKLPAALRVRFVFPHAPVRPVTINNGFPMRAWYDIYGANLANRADLFGIAASQQQVEALLAREKERGIEPRRLVVAGFSQGGAIALHTALRQRTPLGGVLALSTYLPLAGTVAAEVREEALRTPVFMAHGRDDTVVPYALGDASRESLLQLGCQVEWHEYAMPHSVCQEELLDIQRWLVARMNAG